MVAEVNKIIAGELLNHRSVVIPGVGTLYVAHRGARRLSRQKIAAPRNEIDFRPSEEGVSLVELIRRAAGCDEAQAQAVFGRWLAKTREGEVLTLEGIGILRHRAFIPEPAFAAQLNPAGEEVVTLQPRMNRAVVAIAVAAIVVAVAVFGYIEFAPKSVSRFAAQAEKSNVERPKASSGSAEDGVSAAAVATGGERSTEESAAGPDGAAGPDRPAGAHGVCRNSAGGVCTTDRRHGINRSPADDIRTTGRHTAACLRTDAVGVVLRGFRCIFDRGERCAVPRAVVARGAVAGCRGLSFRCEVHGLALRRAGSRRLRAFRAGTPFGVARLVDLREKMSSPASLVTRAVDAFYWCRLEGVVSRQLFRYAFCGGMNLALDAVWYFVIYHFLIGEGRMIDLGFVYMSAPIASLFLVFPITFFTGFWLNRNVAFRASPLGTRTQLLRYALSVAGAILLNYLCMKLFVEVVGIWPTPAKLATSLLSAAYSFLAARYFTFRGAIED